MRSLPLFLAFVAPVMACASQPSFYSFASRAFVPLEQVPARKDLVGTWRSGDERDLVLRPDGKFSMGSSSCCWDVDRRRLLLGPLFYVRGLPPCRRALAIDPDSTITSAEVTSRR